MSFIVLYEAILYFIANFSIIDGSLMQHQAALYQTAFRPVPLEEFIKVGNQIFDKDMNIVRVLPKIADIGGKDPDHIVELCNEVNSTQPFSVPFSSS
jgi:hypothetical protein